MRDYIILNGKKSTEIAGLLIQSLPPISKPLLRTQIEEIDGRDGDIVTPLGFSAYNKTITIGLYGDFDVNQVIAYFNGSGTVTFSNESDKYYYYQIIQQIDYDKLIRFRTATVTFHVQPFKYSISENIRTLTIETVSGSGTVINLKTNGSQVYDFYITGNSQQVTSPTSTSPVPIKVVTGLNNIVFSSGSNSKTYTYDLGDMELCYLSYGNDTFQDLIYKLNGVWYIDKKLERLNIDTSTIEIESHANVAYATIPRNIDSKGYNTSQNIPCLCTNALYSDGLPSGWNTSDAVNKIFTQADSTTYWIGFEMGTTLEQMKDALNNAVIYYPLETPTRTEITDKTLIDQLEAINGSGTYVGNTKITSTAYARATPIYYVSVRNESITVTNVGNYPSRPIMTIYGSGNINVNLNGSEIFIIALGTESYITIDATKMEAYQDGILKNRLVIGNYDNFNLNIGSNTISFTGDVRQVIIENYSRWL